MAPQTDANGLTAEERVVAERMEQQIQRLLDQSYENIQRQSNQALARRRANLITLALRNK